MTLYSDPEPTAEIKKDGAPWSVDELIETVLSGSRMLVLAATCASGCVPARREREGCGLWWSRWCTWCFVVCWS